MEPVMDTEIQVRPPNLEVDRAWLVSQIEDSENVCLMSHVAIETKDYGGVVAAGMRFDTLASFLAHVKHYQEQGAVVFIFRAYMMPTGEKRGFQLLVRMAKKLKVRLDEQKQSEPSAAAEH